MEAIEATTAVSYTVSDRDGNILGHVSVMHWHDGTLPEKVKALAREHYGESNVFKHPSCKFELVNDATDVHEGWVYTI